MAGVPPSEDPEEISRAFIDRYRRDGIAALASLYGPFCMALLDEATQTLLLAVDRMGIESLYVAPVPGGVAFASSLDVLARHPEVSPRISPQALFDYMYFHVVPTPLAVFEGVRRLGPGECVTCERGRVVERRYWTPRFDEDASQPFAALETQFVSALESSVAASIAPNDRVGAFLSGGTDSSTITGLLARLGADVDAFSIGFAADGYDEMDYARIAARHFGVRHHEYYVTADDVVAAVPDLAASIDQPFGNSSVVPAYYCAKLAASAGMATMLAGDGGDELFGGNARYAMQYVFSLYEAIPEAARRHVVEPLARRLPTGISATRKVRRYVEQAATPMPERTEDYNLLRRFGYDVVFADDVLRRIDAGQPLAMQAEAYFNPTAHSLINRQLSLDLKFTLADNDLPKVRYACELAGMPVAFPMLDPRVVDFALRLPSNFKLRGARLRYFFKQALRDFLPDAVIRKRKHGFGLPFGPWLIEHPRLRALAYDSLSDLKRRHLFRAELIDGLHTQVPQHPAYFGTMVWVLMMLEQWFAAHSPALDARNL